MQAIVDFLKEKTSESGRSKLAIAVSGGIDSAVSLTLLTKAVSTDRIHVFFLPFGDQDTKDSRMITEWNEIPEQNVHIVDIKPMADEAAKSLNVKPSEVERLGNVMARMRMVVLYDFVKKNGNDVLVVGTENKSEHHLGYFTRFGDEAADIEPIVHLYKTDVYKLAQELNIPKQIIEKAPSADLWEGQTDEGELGFSYLDADKIMKEYMDNNKKLSEISIQGVSQDTIEKVAAQVDRNRYKHILPYKMGE